MITSVCAFADALGIKPTSGIDFLYFVDRQINNFASAVGGTINSAVMNADVMMSGRSCTSYRSDEVKNLQY